MGDVVKFGAVPGDKLDEEPNILDDVTKGLKKLVDYLAVNRNVSLENSSNILDIAKNIADSAYLEGFNGGSVAWFRVLTKAIEDETINTDVYDQIIETYIELAGGNANESEN